MAQGLRPTFAFSKTIIALLLIATSATAQNRPASSSSNAKFFGISLQSSPLSEPIPSMGASPTVTPTLYRIWDDHATWAELSTVRGVYTWTNLDSILNKPAAGTAFMYTLGPIPTYASSSAAVDANCHFNSAVAGACHPPADNNTSCTAQGSLNGQVFANNCYAREFINDLLLHAAANSTPITYLELGNEVQTCDGSASCDPTSFSSSDVEWIGTTAEHEKMAAAITAQALIAQPGIKVSGPGMSGLGTNLVCTGSNGQTWLNKWLSVGGRSLPLTYLGFHGYFTSATQGPETVLSKIDTLLTCPFIAVGPQLIDSEGGWGNGIMNGSPISTVSRVSNVVSATFVNYPNSHFLTGANVGQTIHIEGVTAGSTSWNGDFTITAVPDTTHLSWSQTAADDCVSPCNVTAGGQQNEAILSANINTQRDYLMRWHLLQFSRGIPIAVWYSYTNNAWGTLCVTYNSSVCLDGTVHPARTAYGEMYKWLADATPGGACAQNGTVWTCNYTKADGYTSQAVWDTSGASTYTFPVGYTQYRIWDGTTALLSGTTQAIGTTPILLEQIPRRRGK